MLGADLERLKSLQGIKWTAEPPDVLPAWVADMDFAPAPAITASIRELVDAGDLGYNLAAKQALIPAWADWLEDRHGWRPPDDECRIFTGTLHGLEVVMEFVTDPGDGVVLFTPIYHPFRNAVIDSGRRVVDVALDGPDYRLDAERFEAAIDDTTKLVLFCQPHNPLGRIFDRAELAAFAEVAERHDLLIISDEVWADLVYETEHVPLYRELPQLRHRLITLGSASKAFNIAGLRCSLAHIGDERIRTRLDQLSMHFSGGPSSLAAAATVAAWQHGGDWLATVRQQLLANRGQLIERVAALDGIAMHSPQATYLAWLDCRESSIAADPAAKLYDIGRLGVHNGDKFCPSAGAFIRINFATSPVILDDMVDRIELTLKETS